MQQQCDQTMNHEFKHEAQKAHVTRPLIAVQPNGAKAQQAINSNKQATQLTNADDNNTAT